MARLRVTAGAFWVRDAGELPRFLAVEMLAQAAAVLLAGADSRSPGYLAGVEEARWSDDVRTGDDLEAVVRVEARLGPVTKVAGSLARDGIEVFSCKLMVRSS